jgi:putative effector of murein hydrolase
VVAFAVLKLWTDIEEVPASLIAGSSHPLFVGMVTNVLFGLLFDLNRERRSIWPWADHVVFWGISLSTAAFTIAILLEADWAFKFITPVLGIAIVVGIAAHSLRLWSKVDRDTLRDAAPMTPGQSVP